MLHIFSGRSYFIFDFDVIEFHDSGSANEITTEPVISQTQFWMIMIFFIDSV